MILYLGIVSLIITILFVVESIRKEKSVYRLGIVILWYLSNAVYSMIILYPSDQIDNYWDYFEKQKVSMPFVTDLVFKHTPWVLLSYHIIALLVLIGAIVALWHKRLKHSVHWIWGYIGFSVFSMGLLLYILNLPITSPVPTNTPIGQPTTMHQVIKDHKKLANLFL